MIFFRSLIVGVLLSIMTSGAALAQCGTTAPANKFCGNDTGSSALATWKSIPPTALSAIAGGTVLGNRTAASAVPTPVTNPVLGIPGSSTGEVGLAGSSSGTAILRAQAAAGSAVSLLPTLGGTLVGSVSSPLVLNATTGLMTCPTCVTSSGGGAITGAAPISVSGAGVVSINSPYVSLTASNGGIVYSGATDLAILAGTGTATRMLQSGASAAPAWSTSTWPATTAAGTMLASASANAVTATATPVLGVAGSTVGSIGFRNATSGTVTLQPATGALGTVTINIPGAAGTMAVSATAPVTLSAAGAIGCTTCLTANQTITLSGDVSGSGATAISTTLATVNSNVGTFGSATQVGQFTVNGKGLITAASNVTVTPAISSITGFGTGVATMLGNAVSAAGGPTTTIASGASALGTSAIASGACATVVSPAATGTLTTDVVLASFNGDPTAVTGYIPSSAGMLTILVYPTSNAANFKVCNNTGSSITPGAITLNWRVLR